MAREWSTRPEIHRALKVDDDPQRGEDVHKLRSAVTRRLRARGRDGVAEEGGFGQGLARSCALALWLLGASRGTVKRCHHGTLSKRGQRIIRNPGTRNPVQLARAVARRGKPYPFGEPDVPGISHGWHPDAERTQVHGGIGAYLNVPRRIVWHTTETAGLPRYSGSHPHFTLDPSTGKLWQHVPITSGAMTLKNLGGGVETNRAGALQVELLGYARDTHTWPPSYYEHIAKLARWLEKHGDVARTCSVTFTDSGGVRKLTSRQWLDYSGHLGHQHVPENDHWDPGRFRIDLIL